MDDNEGVRGVVEEALFRGMLKNLNHTYMAADVNRERKGDD